MSARTAAGAVVAGVRAVARALDPAAPGTRDELAALLEVTDALLHRAALDDALARTSPDRGWRRAVDLAARAVDGDAGAAARLADLVAERAPVELAALPAADPLRTPDPAGARSGTTTAALADYLRSRDDPRVLLSSTVLTGGFSKETVLLRLDGPGGPEEVALRRVAAGRAADTLADEYATIGVAAAHGLPVAAPLWLDRGPTTLGGPLFATRAVPGTTVGTVSGPGPGATPAVARELAGVLGRLHALDPGGLRPPRPPAGTREQLLAAVDEREKVLHGVADALPAGPGLALHAALLAWLRIHAPSPAGPPVLVHGDAGFHNLLVDGGRISALLDWELAHLGRPAEDLAYVRPAVTRLLGWPEFLDHYTRAGGTVPDETELRYFTVWQDAWRAVSCLRLRTRFVLDPVRLSDGVSGLLLSARFLDGALRSAHPEAFP